MSLRVELSFFAISVSSVAFWMVLVVSAFSWGSPEFEAGNEGELFWDDGFATSGAE